MKVWKIEASIWVGADTEEDAVRYLNKDMRVIIDPDKNILQAYETNSVKLDYTEI